MSESSPAKFSVRDVAFDFDDTVPRYWHSQRRAVTIFFNNLSTVFPLGERFFIKSVAHYRAAVEDDEQLRAEVRAFTSQEAIHTREHEAYNDMLRRHGVDVDGIERGVARLLRLPRLAGPLRHRVSLSATTALEHWTALLGHFVLADDTRVLDGADPRLAAIWRWHAAEECEHKAVAFDVYTRSGGGYLVRALVMLMTTMIFWARILQQQWMIMRSDGIAWSFAQWRDLARFLFVEQRILRLVPPWLAYFSPWFHPWQLDDSALLERWREEHAGGLRYRKRATRVRARVEPTPEPAPLPGELSPV
ncbi:MAG: metal-dependent hydrolase [Myxococcales bacterium]|nr:metal-dependent hydrolase [Myxococcales bacterium]